jgi:hypothetical protein
LTWVKNEFSSKLRNANQRFADAIPLSDGPANLLSGDHVYRHIGLFLLVASMALAQESRGSISGVVTDAQLAVIANAKVVITNLDTRVDTVLVPNERGVYLATLLLVGNYRSAAGHAGVATMPAPTPDSGGDRHGQPKRGVRSSNIEHRVHEEPHGQRNRGAQNRPGIGQHAGIATHGDPARLLL